MPRVPSSRPDGLMCDPRLPEAALAFRKSTPELLSPDGLGRINVTAWLYSDDKGIQQVIVNPNITLPQIWAEFGRAPTRDAETGIHSEAIAAEFFRKNPRFRVRQIFTERVPCSIMCAPLLKNYFPGIPWFYYYDRQSWRGDNGEVIKRAAAVLKAAYGL